MSFHFQVGLFCVPVVPGKCHHRWQVPFGRGFYYLHPFFLALGKCHIVEVILHCKLCKDWQTEVRYLRPLSHADISSLEKKKKKIHTHSLPWLLREDRDHGLLLLSALASACCASCLFSNGFWPGQYTQSLLPVVFNVQMSLM